VIVPIWKKEEEKAAVLEAGAEVQKRLKAGGVRVKLDANEQRTPGWKFNFWEMKVRTRMDPVFPDQTQFGESE
jgi:prolyl-tRNA synthetase